MFDLVACIIRTIKVFQFLLVIVADPPISALFRLISRASLWIVGEGTNGFPLIRGKWQVTEYMLIAAEPLESIVAQEHK